MGSNLVFCGVFFFNSFIRTQLCLSIYILSLSPIRLKGQIWGRWYSLNKNCKACKAEHVYYLAFYRKSLPVPWLDYCDILKRLQNIVAQNRKVFFFVILCFHFTVQAVYRVKKHCCWQPPIFLHLSFCYPVV